MKQIVTLDVAIKSGRKFRFAGLRAPHIRSHLNETGHAWRMSGPSPTKEQSFLLIADNNLNLYIQCCECKDLLAVPKYFTDTWIVEQSEDELESEALSIINGLGLKIKKEEVVGV